MRDSTRGAQACLTAQASRARRLATAPPAPPPVAFTCWKARVAHDGRVKPGLRALGALEWLAAAGPTRNADRSAGRGRPHGSCASSLNPVQEDADVRCLLWCAAHCWRRPERVLRAGEDGRAGDTASAGHLCTYDLVLLPASRHGTDAHARAATPGHPRNPASTACTWPDSPGNPCCHPQGRGARRKAATFLSAALHLAGRAACPTASRLTATPPRLPGTVHAADLTWAGSNAKQRAFAERIRVSFGSKLWLASAERHASAEAVGPVSRQKR